MKFDIEKLDNQSQPAIGTAAAIGIALGAAAAGGVTGYLVNK